MGWGGVGSLIQQEGGGHGLCHMVTDTGTYTNGHFSHSYTTSQRAIQKMPIRNDHKLTLCINKIRMSSNSRSRHLRRVRRSRRNTRRGPG